MRTLSFLLFFGIAVNGFSQMNIGGQVGYLTTGNEFYLHMKDGFGFEGFGSFEFDDNLRARFGASYRIFKPTYDTLYYTIPNYDGSILGASYLSEIYVHKKYNLGLVYLGADYLIPFFYLKERFRFYPGWDIFAGRIKREYSQSDDPFGSTSLINSWTYGSRVRLNAEIEIGLYSIVYLQAGYSLFRDDEFNNFYGFYQVSLGYAYILD